MYRENNLYLRGILFRDTSRGSNCVLRVTAFLWKDQEFDCAVFLVTTLFFFFFRNNIPIPLFLRDLVWFIFRTHPPHFSFVYLCFQLQWNKKKKKKPRLQPRASSFVQCFVLVFFFWLPATKSHRHYHIKAKQSSPSYVLNELPLNTAAIFYLDMNFVSSVMSVGVGWVVENFCYICISVAFGKKKNPLYSKMQCKYQEYGTQHIGEASRCHQGAFKTVQWAHVLQE